MLTPRHLLARLGCALILCLGLSQAATAMCFADYKAKQEDPLQLHYGIIELTGDMCPDDPEDTDLVAQVTERIEADGWMLLNVVSIFAEDGLAEREESAGEFYLRY